MSNKIIKILLIIIIVILLFQTIMLSISLSWWSTKYWNKLYTLKTIFFKPSGTDCNCDCNLSDIEEKLDEINDNLFYLIQ